jgi:hypothetical protein
MSLTKDVVRLIFRRGTRSQVETDGSTVNSITRYAGEPFYDTTNGHLWISNGTSQVKVDPRGIVAFENESVFFDNEIVIY